MKFSGEKVGLSQSTRQMNSKSNTTFTFLPPQWRSLDSHESLHMRLIVAPSDASMEGTYRRVAIELNTEDEEIMQVENIGLGEWVILAA